MKNNILYSSAFAFGIAVPLSTRLGNVTLGFFLVSLLFFFNGNKFKENTKKLWFSTIHLFALLVFGFVFSENIEDGINLLGRYASYLLIPVFLLFLDKDQIATIKIKSLYGLIIGVTLASLILLVNNFVRYYSTRPFFTFDKDLFNYYYTYHNFTKRLGFYPTYFGLYALLSLGTSLDILFKKKSLIQKTLLSLSVVILLFTILFLNARTITGVTAAVVLYYSIIFLKIVFNKNKTCFFIIILMMFSVLIGLFFSVRKTYMFSRFSQELIWDLTPNVNTAYNGKYKADSRIVRWETAISLIKERPILGYGCAMEKKVLHQKFEQNGLNFAAKNNYDAHNQYLSITIEFGLIGLSLFLFYLFSNLYFSIQEKDKTVIVFFISLLSIAVFENIFKNNAGIIFIAFFSNLFLFTHQKK
ncbi:O-antigen ligase family protein [Flavobacterium sp. CYK-55]|uniref:O-antigen ligase family protein n=1 Tax=Flavobacterium sp. CYK-55 TaxID=2835529 RepID=UPI001BD0112F|nr:O-antigen ligase family protein [Flavobacterium sp. CYK-55]MBS7787522.1 O-antigen ligase family protein [Flavobacterium sp. CYK-55]